MVLRPKNTVLRANTARNLGLRWKALGREPNPKRTVEAVYWAVYQRGLTVTRRRVRGCHCRHPRHGAEKIAAFLRITT